MFDVAGQELVDQAQSAGLLSGPQVAKLNAVLSNEGVVAVDKIAASLLDKRLLTAFQIEHLRDGRGRECVLAGRYVLLERLGAGGMGVVYRARDAKLERIVAIKVIAPKNLSNPDAVLRFQREAKALAKVSHSAIVQAYDVGEDHGRHFLVMEHVEGQSLQHLLRSQGRLAPAQAANYGLQAAFGLHHAHERGLVHRDIKPANLLVTDRHELKILDLGLARFLQDLLGEPSVTAEGMGLGTPDYMAPEQFRDAIHADPRSDIYALGCTLYHVLAGQVPFPGSSLTVKALAHQQQTPPSLAERCPEAPNGLTQIVERMMAKQPTARFATAQEVADALARHVSDAAPALRATGSWSGTPHGSTFPERTENVGRRRAFWAIVVGALIVGLALLALVGAPFFRGENPDANPTDQPPPRDPKVLTVSRESTEGGEFRTIGEALKNARPGVTIRILDKASYAEPLVIDDPDKHRGIVLEAPHHATIELTAEAKQALLIDRVAQVAVKGFRFRAHESLPYQDPTKELLRRFVTIKSECPGVILHNLTMTSTKPVVAVFVENVNILDVEAPLVIRECFFDVAGDAILVNGALAQPVKCVLIQDNQITNATRGITLEYGVNNIQVTGNVVGKCKWASLEIRNLVANADQILVANNTFYGDGSDASGVRIWQDPFATVKFKKGQVVLSNNIIVGHGADIAYFCMAKDPSGPSPSDFLLDLWDFDHNWRDLGGSEVHKLLPLAKGDRKLQRNELILLASHRDFLRPRKDSPLANGGAGRSDLSLPAYVGAVPPEDVPSHAWEKTWRARMIKR